MFLFNWRLWALPALAVASLAACGKMAELERPAPLIGAPPRAAPEHSARGVQIETVDPRNRSRREPAPR